MVSVGEIGGEWLIDVDKVGAGVSVGTSIGVNKIGTTGNAVLGGVGVSVSVGSDVGVSIGDGVYVADGS